MIRKNLDVYGLEKLLKEKRKKAIWGTGYQALLVTRKIFKLSTINEYGIKYVIDNNSENRGKFFENIQIKHPDDLENWDDLFIIVAINEAYSEVKEQLEGFGLVEKKDFISWLKIDYKAVLGISALYHDSAAVLLINDEIVAAAQEERFTRIKHDPGFPVNAIKYCLEQGNITYGDVDAVVYYDNPFLTLDRLTENLLWAGENDKNLFQRNFMSVLGQKLWIHKEIEKISHGQVKREKVYVCEHHISHAASAFYASPFEEAAVITFDGVGEWATSTIGIGKGSELKLIKEIDYPHSLGLLYSAFTFFCGFKVNSGEYKLMGLAPYGTPVYYDTIKEKLIDICDDGSYKIHLEYFDYYLGGNMTNEKFAQLFGGPERKPESQITKREMDLAASIQKITEEVVIKTARYASRLTGMKNLCMAGGTALNCVVNGKLLKEEIFENIWIQPAAGDAGGALGAAYYAYYNIFHRLRQVKLPDAQRGSYLGPAFSEDEIVSYLAQEGCRYKDYSDKEDEFYKVIAKYLIEDKVIGLFSGRMEFGPRALGNRSIIANPKTREMQSKLNLKIKFRESFRPFAPTVLQEKCSEYFELDKESPYMLLVADVKENLRNNVNFSEDLGEEEEIDILKLVNMCRSEIPAVTHLDYSARIQTVSRKINPDYYRIIEEFYKISGCACIVNTSFNVRGEPIVCSPKDAYICFRRTDMDVLVLGKCILLKEEQDAFSENINWKEVYALD